MASTFSSVTSAATGEMKTEDRRKCTAHIKYFFTGHETFFGQKVLVLGPANYKTVRIPIQKCIQIESKGC